jgi:Fe-S cluster biogenesis protein NfuA
MREQLETLLGGLKPMLAMQEKDVQILEVTDKKISLILSGCCSDCECSTDYVEGLREMLSQSFPNVEIDIAVA